MADAYWRYGDSRQQPAALVAKRPRPEFEKPSSTSYYSHEDNRGAGLVVRDTDAVNASYERYLRSRQTSVYGGETGRSRTEGIGGQHFTDDARVLTLRGPEAVVSAKIESLGMGGHHEHPLPPYASSTLFVEGFPSNCTRREVSHIFRPFLGYEELRLVIKKPRHPGGELPVTCFVDFQSPAHAATAMDALQGYRFDEHDRDSNLRIQFSRYQGSRSGGAGHRGEQ